MEEPLRKKPPRKRNRESPSEKRRSWYWKHIGNDRHVAKVRTDAIIDLHASALRVMTRNTATAARLGSEVKFLNKEIKTLVSRSNEKENAKVSAVRNYERVISDNALLSQRVEELEHNYAQAKSEISHLRDALSKANSARVTEPSAIAAEVAVEQNPLNEEGLKKLSVNKRLAVLPLKYSTKKPENYLSYLPKLGNFLALYVSDNDRSRFDTSKFNCIVEPIGQDLIKSLVDWARNRVPAISIYTIWLDLTKRGLIKPLLNQKLENPQGLDLRRRDHHILQNDFDTLSLKNIRLVAKVKSLSDQLRDLRKNQVGERQRNNDVVIQNGIRETALSNEIERLRSNQNETTFSD